MRRGFIVLLFALLGFPAAAGQPVRIAIIIDDLGHSRSLGLEAVELPGDITYSVLPQVPYSRAIARRAHAVGKEVMLHLPMQPLDGRPMGPGGLHNAMNREEFAHVVWSSVSSIPHVAGVNNHMGSMLTRQPEAMRWLMQDLRCIGGLYFVDSRTDVRTVAREFARQEGLANAQRDIFLDNQQEPEYVRYQFKRLIEIARRRGTAVGIGHPYPETLAVLAEQLPVLAAEGIELVPVSRLVDNQRSDKLWHACSSPLRRVAKNSRP